MAMAWPVVAQEHQCVTVNATGCGLDSDSTKWNIYLNFLFSFPPKTGGIARWVALAYRRALPPRHQSEEMKILRNNNSFSQVEI